MCIIENHLNQCSYFFLLFLISLFLVVNLNCANLDIILVDSEYFAYAFKGLRRFSTEKRPLFETHL